MALGGLQGGRRGVAFRWRATAPLPLPEWARVWGAVVSEEKRLLRSWAASPSSLARTPHPLRTYPPVACCFYFSLHVQVSVEEAEARAVARFVKANRVEARELQRRVFSQLWSVPPHVVSTGSAVDDGVCAWACCVCVRMWRALLRVLHTRTPRPP